MTTDLLPHEKGYAAKTDAHGDALSDIKDPPRQGTTTAATPAPPGPATGAMTYARTPDRAHAVVTFECYDKATGAKQLADDRTFDPETMSLDPVKKAAP